MESLRSRKKAQTKHRIIEAAMQLTQKNGYQAATIAAICAQADIAQRTFFSYFPSKEAVFFGEKQEVLKELSDSIDTRSTDTTTFQVVRSMLERRSFQEITEAQDLFAYHQSLAGQTRQLRAYSDSLDQQIEAVLRRGFARDLACPPDSLGPTLAAAVTGGALRIVFLSQVQTDTLQNKETIMATLDSVLTFLEAGIATIK